MRLCMTSSRGHVVTVAAGQLQAIEHRLQVSHSSKIKQLCNNCRGSRAQLVHLEVHVPEVSHVTAHHLVAVAEDDLA